MPLTPDAESAKRIAIRSRDSETGEALWQAIAEGCEKRKAGEVARAGRGEAGIAIYLLTAADLADARGTASEIAKDPAPVKYLLEPAGDATMRARAAPAMAALAKIAATKVFASEGSTLSFSAEETMQRQAREIVRALKGKPEAPKRDPKEAKAAKEARKAPKSKEGTAKRSVKTAAKPAKKRVAKKTAKKAAAKTELAETAAAGPAEERAAKKAQREGARPSPEERAAKRAAKRTGRGAAAPSPEEQAAKRAAKKAAKDLAAAKILLSLEERAAKHAAKKAQRAAAKPPVQPVAEPAPKKPSLSAEERAAKKAERAAAKPSPEERAAQRAAKKAAKQPAAKKASLSAEERAEKRAAKKAQHEAKKAQHEAKKAERAAALPSQDARAAKKTERLAAAPSVEEKAVKRAAKKAEHEAKKAQHEAKKAERAAALPSQDTSTVVPAEEKAAKRAAKKAEHEIKKAGHAAKKAQHEAKKAERATVSPEAREAERAAKKAERLAALPSPEEKAAKREAKRAERLASLPSQEERAAKRAAKLAGKAERRKKREPQIGPDGEIIDETRPLRVVLVGFGEARAAPLRALLDHAFQAAGVALEEPRKEGSRCDLAVHAFDGLSPEEIAATASTMAESKVRVRLFLERIGGGDEINRAIAMLASACGAAVLRLNARLSRFPEPPAEPERLVAEAILGAAAGRLPQRGFAHELPTAPPDLVEARALADDPVALLARLRWTGAPAKSLWAPIARDEIEALAEGNIRISDELSIPARLPVDWDMEIEGRRAEASFRGLEFLVGPLAYFYAKASGTTSERISEIDAALKARGSSPGALLQRATQLIEDFLARNPPEEEPEAWQEHPLAARARVLALYVLCCKAAAKRKLKYNEEVCAVAYGGLLDLLEIMRADDFYQPCSLEGVEQDCLTVGLALTLRGTPYGAALLAETLERFRTMQLDIGLTQDGVWYTDSYSVHCSVLAEMSMMLADFPASEAAVVAPFAAVAKKMTAFAEAMLKSNGAPPVIDDSRQRSYAERLSGQRRLIAKAASGGKKSPAKTALVKRITDTYVFREAQYFISHSSQTITPDSSLAVLHADPPSVVRGDPGGVVLAFSHGERDLIVRAKPAEKVRTRGDRTPLYEPQLRNGYRVDGHGNEPPAPGGEKRARIVKSWRGPGWAAARSIEDTYANAHVARVAIHLKAASALVVVDALTGAGEFEQFFNIGKDFAPPETLSAPLGFVSAPDSVLGIAFAEDAGGQIDRAEDHSTLHRRLGPGLTAAIFQWTDGSPGPAVAILRGGAEDWAVRVSGKGFSAEIVLGGTELRCELGT